MRNGSRPEASSAGSARLARRVARRLVSLVATRAAVGTDAGAVNTFGSRAVVGSRAAVGSRAVVASLLVAASLVAAPPAAAQDYPAKPVRAVVGFPPGGTVDLNARVIGQKLGELWGQQVLVDNKGGAGSTIGAALVAQAPADGYTILFASPAHAINATLYKSLPYDTESAFVAVTQVTSTPLILYAHPALPASNVAELVVLAKAKPGSLNFGFGGNGTSVHLAAVLLAMVSGTEMTLVPYQGGGPAATGLLAGDIQLMLSGSEYMTHVRNGKLKALAVTTSKRAASFPEIPTVAESGLPGYEVETWYGVYAPAGTQPRIVKKLADDIGRALQAPDVRERFAKGGFTIVGSTPEQFAAFTKAEIEKWRRVVREAKVSNE